MMYEVVHPSLIVPLRSVIFPRLIILHPPSLTRCSLPPDPNPPRELPLPFNSFHRGPEKLLQRLHLRLFVYLVLGSSALDLEVPNG